MLDSKGNMIGINTAIFTQTGNQLLVSGLFDLIKYHVSLNVTAKSDFKTQFYEILDKKQVLLGGG